jgi:hypothetical protein
MKYRGRPIAAIGSSPDPAEMAQRRGPETTTPDWRVGFG